jgi:hypothetical protein
MPLVTACASGVGEICRSDDDWRPGLRCTARPEERGVCTYPEGAVDAAPDLSDPRPPDLEPLDLGPDAAVPDATVDGPGDSRADARQGDTTPDGQGDTRRGDASTDRPIYTDGSLETSPDLTNPGDLTLSDASPSAPAPG